MSEYLKRILSILRPAPVPAETEPVPIDHAAVVREAARLHREGIELLAASREKLKLIYPYANFEEDAVVQQSLLNVEIESVLRRYCADPGAYKYFYGHPYQALAIAGVFGDRVCDYRFDAYDLHRFIQPSDTVLDIGCNCGFMCVLASYRTGCRSIGIDINPYMTEIGTLVARHLGVSERVSLVSGDLRTYSPERTVDIVMSFATHWTDDENYRVSLDEHMRRMHGYLKPGGTLIFETHCNDLGDPDFKDAMTAARELFAFDGCYKRTDSGTRELYIMQRRKGGSGAQGSKQVDEKSD